MKLNFFTLNDFMKTNILIISLLSSISFNYAQNVNTSVASDMNTVFSLLEKKRIPYDIHLDYGYDFIDVSQYNGTLQTNNYLSIGN
ncbi:hypothetical protein [Gelatiniphilus marinus]|uniref:Uncharacterized protein n=1 Tax=Gelatiniphilus marinus TaxID=1759464 RepID=A0ABW5JX26_9FLAO